MCRSAWCRVWAQLFNGRHNAVRLSREGSSVPINLEVVDTIVYFQFVFFCCAETWHRIRPLSRITECQGTWNFIFVKLIKQIRVVFCSIHLSTDLRDYVDTRCHWDFQLQLSVGLFLSTFSLPEMIVAHNFFFFLSVDTINGFTAY